MLNKIKNVPLLFWGIADEATNDNRKQCLLGYFRFEFIKNQVHGVDIENFTALMAGNKNDFGVNEQSFS